MNWWKTTKSLSSAPLGAGNIISTVVAATRGARARTGILTIILVSPFLLRRRRVWRSFGINYPPPSCLPHCQFPREESRGDRETHLHWKPWDASQEWPWWYRSSHPWNTLDKSGSHEFFFSSWSSTCRAWSWASASSSSFFFGWLGLQLLNIYIIFGQVLFT